MFRRSLLAGASILTMVAGVAQAQIPGIGRSTTPATTAGGDDGVSITPLYRNIRGFYGNIHGFWGDVNPFYGNIHGFWGDLNPFYGNIHGFWGSIDPASMATVAGAPMYAGVAPFWNDLGAQWDAIASDWRQGGSYEGNEARYGQVSGRLGAFVDSSAAFWGGAIERKTGRSFQEGFADPLLARFGLNPADPASLSTLSANDQARFFISWYDGLMEFSGTDHADWWMRSVRWSPKLTQTQGGGSQAVIGLVDFFVAADDDIKSKLIYSGGVSRYSNGHGSGVGSLIVASHDGKGIMGIAPNAKVAAYNPFDASGSTDWATVRAGIRAVTGAGASVVNLSLGVPGSTLSPEWAKVFRDPAIKALGKETVYVIAAGNDGVTQTANIDFTGASDSAFIVVGSVDPTNRISDFSNRPGTACLTAGVTLGACQKVGVTGAIGNSTYLMNRFIVAPGELLLVSDGQGGVTRESGTSLSAPLVAGAITLIQDRWPWLKKQPGDVADIILKSARDLGEPGTDPVYGAGLLDVEAAQSPLSFDALSYYQYDGKKVSKVDVKSLRGKGIQSNWEAKDMYLVAFEELGSSQRDFLIPLSSRLVGTMKDGRYFQDFVYNAMTGWLTGAKKFASAPGGYGFSNVQRYGDVSALGEWRMSLSGRMTDGFAGRDGYYRPRIASAMGIHNLDGTLGFSMGTGDGAVMLGGGNGFGMTSDFDPYSGGVNPLLGFASGGTHLSAHVGLSPRLAIAIGTTEQTRSRRRDLVDVRDAADRLQLGNLDRYRSQASNIRIDYQASDSLALSATYTRLAEPNALLGVRSLDTQDFHGGNVSNGMTVSADLHVGGGLALFGSATGMRATSAGAGSSLRIADGGVLGTSYQLGVAKSGIAGRTDRLRLSVAQPLTIERGNMALTSVAVVDRETGQIGLVSQQFDISNTARRRLVAEGLYSAPSIGRAATVSLFGRAEMRRVDADTPELMIGTRAQLLF